MEDTVIASITCEMDRAENNHEQGGGMVQDLDAIKAGTKNMPYKAHFWLNASPYNAAGVDVGGAPGASEGLLFHVFADGVEIITSGPDGRSAGSSNGFLLRVNPYAHKIDTNDKLIWFYAEKGGVRSPESKPFRMS